MAGIVSRLPSGKPRNHGSVPGSNKRKRGRGVTFNDAVNCKVNMVSVVDE